MAVRHFITSYSKELLSTFVLRGSLKNSSRSYSKSITNIVGSNSKSFIPPILSNFDVNERSKMHNANPSGRTICDPLVNSFVKEIYVPTIASNMIKVYQDNPANALLHIIDPLVNNLKIIDAPRPGKVYKKEAVRMIRIRRRKMRKHKKIKHLRKFRLLYEKMSMRRQLREEQAFRMKLLTQIEEAQNFDAKEYVTGIIHKLRYHPKLETREEQRERYRLLKKKNKSNTTFIVPRFDV